MGDQLKGKIQLQLFLFRFRRGYIATFVGLVTGIASILLEPPLTFVVIGLAAISTLLGIALFWKSLIDARSFAQNIHHNPVRPADMKPNLSKRYTGYILETFHEKQAIYHPRVNELLESSGLKAYLSSKKFPLPNEVMQIAPHILRERFGSNSVFFNAKKVRLATDLTVELTQAGGRVQLQQTDYFAFLGTNRIFGQEFWFGPGRRTLLFDGLGLTVKEKILLNLDESLNANLIATSTLAFIPGEDLQYLVVVLQGIGNDDAQNELAPSGSGSADFADFHRPEERFRDFLVRAMERELLEECNPKELESPPETRLIGFARFLFKGGNPEFFGVTRLAAGSGSLEPPKKEGRYIADIEQIPVHLFEPAKLKKDLREYRKKKEHLFSMTLHLNFKFLEEWLDKDPDSFLALMGQPPKGGVVATGED